MMKVVLESPRHASEELAAAVRLQHVLTYLVLTSSDIRSSERGRRRGRRWRRGV